MSELPHRSSLSDNEAVREVVPRFIGRLAGYVQKMRAAFNEGRADELRYIAHNLRGAGSSFGFQPISVHAGAIDEALSAHQSISSVEANLNALITYIEHIEGYRPE